MTSTTPRSGQWNRRICDDEADGGIDGRVYFAIPDSRELQSMVVEVKGGATVNVTDLRALKGVLDNDQALMAGLIIMKNAGRREGPQLHKVHGRRGDAGGSRG